MNLNKIILIDGQKMFLQSFVFLLKNIFQFKYVIEKVYDSFQEIEDIAALNQHLIIADINFLEQEEIDQLLSQIKNSSSKLIILTDNRNHNQVRKIMQGGASAYLLKSNDYKEFEKALYEVNSNRTYLGTDVYVAPPTLSLKTVIGGQSYPSLSSKNITNILTRREKEILRLIIQTKDNREISSELFISEQTVIVHKKNIMKKFGIRSTINLIRYTVEQGIVETL
jgi:DNA-binding NarL/FixJ family response regulator